MNYRRVIVTAESILELFKDYMKGEVPLNSRVVGFRYHRNDKGKLSIVVASPDWRYEDQDKPLLAHFDMRKGYVAGGVTPNEN